MVVLGYLDPCDEAGGEHLDLGKRLLLCFKPLVDHRCFAQTTRSPKGSTSRLVRSQLQCLRWLPGTTIYWSCSATAVTRGRLLYIPLCSITDRLSSAPSSRSTSRSRAARQGHSRHPRPAQRRPLRRPRRRLLFPTRRFQPRRP
jgi:hypothetical protein